MTDQFRTSSELQQARAAHVENIARLERLMPTANPGAAARSVETVANLRSQVRDIDAELAFIRKQRSSARSAA